MKFDIIYDVVKELVGKIDPVGETNEDNRRFENLKTMTALVEALLSDIDYVAITYSDRGEYSMSRAGKYAGKFNKDLDRNRRDNGI